MLGRGIDQIQLQSVPPKIYEDYLSDARTYVKLAENENGAIPRFVSPSYVWGEALHLFKQRRPDIKIINLETSITLSDRYYPKGINYRMHPMNVSILEDAGIDLCALANNHVLDYGIQGLKDTMTTLDIANILYAGAGATLEEAQSPAILETKEGRLIFFSMAHSYSGVPDGWGASDKMGGVYLIKNFNAETIEKITSLIKNHKREGDIVVLSIHWGSNWGHEIPNDHRDFAHALIDRAGVDILYGHSSHHPRAIEVYNGRPVFYGCGDFINDYEGISGNDEFRGNLVLAYFVDVQVRPFKLKNIDLDCLMLKHFQLIKPPLKDVQWMFTTINHVSEGFQTPLQLDGKSIFCELT